MPRTATATAYTYVDCPACGQGITEPFRVTRTKATYVHRHSRTTCRIVVKPMPHRSRTWEVPHLMSLEEALQRLDLFPTTAGGTVGTAGSTVAA